MGRLTQVTSAGRLETADVDVCGLRPGGVVVDGAHVSSALSATLAIDTPGHVTAEPHSGTTGQEKKRALQAIYWQCRRGLSGGGFPSGGSGWQH